MLVALHVIAVLVLATPSTRGVIVRSAWADATVQDEFRTWSEALDAFGLELSPAELEASLWSWSRRYARARESLVAVFEPYTDCCGTRQSWRMFSAPHRYPSRLVVDIEREGRWDRIYSARSDVHDWRRRQLDHVRLRTAVFHYAWPHARQSYDQFVRWLAALAARDFPEATRIRVHYLKGRSATPEELRSGALPSLEARKIRVVELLPQDVR